MDPDTPPPAEQPGVLNYLLSFLLVGLAWGFTTPFIRRAAVDFNARNEAKQNVNHSDTRHGEQSFLSVPWIKEKIVSVFWTVVNLLRTPAYSVPLLINLTGSVWFFLLVGKHGMHPWLFLSLLYICKAAF